MQVSAVILLVTLYACSEAFEFDFVGKSNNFASGGDDYIRSVGTRRDLSLAGASGGLERPSSPRRLIQPPPLKRSIKEPLPYDGPADPEKVLELYRWLSYNAPPRMDY